MNKEKSNKTIFLIMLCESGEDLYIPVLGVKIKKRVDYYLYFADIGEDEDRRNYSVSYEKINSLGFKTKKTLDEGINELIKACQILEFRHSYKNI